MFHGLLYSLHTNLTAVVVKQSFFISFELRQKKHSLSVVCIFSIILYRLSLNVHGGAGMCENRPKALGMFVNSKCV